MTSTPMRWRYDPARHYAFTPHHDGATATRTLPDGTEQTRMECRCGKRSRWSELSAPTMRAQNRHADEVAR